ncbi:branched-chain amino acid ABC transporter permease [Loktanella sp. M215]|uniref:branched-chain amino acid ABC transporter permease n=1 Tax=Loktanella sp. M215 TaxID=2675431 RepID=UPI001F34DE12|nr:branched-chain amino acid ABC transporter permease [Loktanella sp. M215]MBU2359060.1 branched-chain amino acid ABC transporter permease [Alphaproteobacteria bacterium]MCF7701355.1 branched-chain amino acid ABC transporter permease [Loktanella sp. M215]
MGSAYILSQIVNGVILGSMYALIAIGFTMIYGIVRLINFAHGDIFTMGAFTTLASLALIGLPFPVALVVVVLTGALFGVVIERIAFRPMRGAPQVTGFIASLAVAIILENLLVMTISAQPRVFLVPEYLNRLVATGVITIRVIDLAIVALAIVLMIALVFFVQFTKVGIAMRATAENYDVARLMGINIDRMIMLAFAIGSGLAAVSGLMWGSKYGQISPFMGLLPGLKAFVAAVIGGVGSIPGAVVGGYVLGLSEVLFVGLLPPEYSGYRNAFVFGALIVVLLVMPNGLLGRNTETRA